ncbi:hypothetical protein [Catenovulum agarivorans]|uniref:hypothetical protein n=1 Tax=Catenovulum agarivorans TaxID=1172192 RepID=UPI0002F947C1|nr:hypothetical protein [Catenovulum agarivorans]
MNKKTDTQLMPNACTRPNNESNLLSEVQSTAHPLKSFIEGFEDANKVPKLNLYNAFNTFDYLVGLLEDSIKKIELGLSTPAINEKMPLDTKNKIKKGLEQLTHAVAIVEVKTNDYEQAYMVYKQNPITSIDDLIKASQQTPSLSIDYFMGDCFHNRGCNLSTFFSGLKPTDSLNLEALANSYSATQAFLYLIETAHSSLLHVLPNMSKYYDTFRVLQLLSDWATLQAYTCEQMVDTVRLLGGEYYE